MCVCIDESEDEKNILLNEFDQTLDLSDNLI